MSVTRDRSRPSVLSETLDAVANLTIEARRVVEGLQGGLHASPHFGASVEFAEHKRYGPGEDVRHIDWRALARTDRYYLKQYQREVILRCLMAVDCSASMSYRGARAKVGKLEYASLLTAAMAHILVRQGDAAGLVAFADKPMEFVPPRSSPDHLPALMARLASLRSSERPGTGFNEMMARIAEAAGNRSMVVIASDLWGANRETEVALSNLAARGHDVVVFHVLDPDETDLPFDRTAIFRGLEGEPEVEADPNLLRKEYRDEVKAVLERWRRICGEAGIDLFLALTSEPPEKVLADFAQRRHNLRRHK